MNDLTQEISEDYNLDASEVSFEDAFDHDLDMLSNDVQEITFFDDELRQLMNTTLAIESYGMNPTAFGLMRTTGLLSGTSLEVLAMENFRFEGPSDPESEMALEALTDKIKAKAVEWSAKVLNFVKTMANKIAGGLSTLWDKIVEQGKSLTAKAWDATKVAGTYVKAHPYKTIVIAIAAAAAVAAIIAMVATGNYANESAMKPFLYKMQDMINKIKWPFGNIVAKVAPDGSKILCHTEITKQAANAAAKAGEMGWTQTTVKAISGQLSRVWSTMKSSINTVSSKVVSAAKFVDMGGEEAGNITEAVVKAKTKSKLLGWAGKEITKKMYMAGLWSIVAVLYALMRDIVTKTFKMVSDTFRSLKPVAQAA